MMGFKQGKCELCILKLVILHKPGREAAPVFHYDNCPSRTAPVQLTGPSIYEILAHLYTMCSVSLSDSYQLPRRLHPPQMSLTPRVPSTSSCGLSTSCVLSGFLKQEFTTFKTSYWKQHRPSGLSIHSSTLHCSRERENLTTMKCRQRSV